MPKSKTKPLTAMVARYIRNARYNDVPRRIMDPLLQSIADTVGCGLRGSQSDYAQLLGGYAGEWGSKGEAVVWGTDQRAATPIAAMVNCAACHAWDYDDTIMPAVLHPGSVALPTALAIAERSRTPVSGRTLVTALAAGYEVGNIMGTALGAKRFASDGFYNSVPTIFVAAATACKLLNLNELQTMRALGLAAQQAAGLYSATLAKRFNAPKAVLGGIMAADMALRGMEAPVDGIEAPYSGFLGTFARSPEPEVIPRDLGKYRFEIFHKFYPCIRSNHPTVDNLRLLLEENPDIKTGAIRRIVSHVDPLTVDYTVGTTAGGADGVHTVGNALISLHYCVAAMAVDRELTFRQFTPAKLRNPAIKAVMPKIELVGDKSIDKLPATKRYRCKIEVHLADGRVVKRALEGPKGDPNNRLTRDEMIVKFVDNAGEVMPAARARTLFGLLEGLDKAKDVRPIVRKLAVAAKRGR